MISHTSKEPSTRARAALVTLAVGNVPEARWSHPIFRAYAQRHGLDFIVINTWRIKKGWRWFTSKRQRIPFEKLQLHRLLGDYERAIYFDGDILIHPDCPNLLNLVPAKSLGAVSDEYPAGGTEAQKRRGALENAEKKLGALLPESAALPYFNAGMLVLSQACRPALDPAQDWPPDGRWREQTGINYFARKFNLSIEYLDAKYNFTPLGGARWQDAAQRRGGGATDALVIHYAGLADRARMAGDAPFFWKAWGIAGEGGA